MNNKTNIYVIDHHPLRPNLPKDWNVTSEEIGATATLMVEAMREKNGMLTVPQATLLLLGIYEDTGSLTYTRTTSRDAEAAAFLLNQGANLQVVQDFLNHPLSTRQQELFEELRRGAEIKDINGQQIVITRGQVKDTDEELSSIAHKLRDTIDLDAIILLVDTRGGVQLIARSSTDFVDVSAVAQHFGGGGHPRASAALIQGIDQEQAYDDLLKLLPNIVKPAITVQEIMSKNPQLLKPNDSAKNAAKKMQRYGYEGFPVVDNDRVVGLLTRRDVDRSLAHNMNLDAEELMIAGDIHVAPTDSIEYLQRVMTDSNWGQIPVIDPNNSKIVGIVTRTDLIKTLTPNVQMPGIGNLSRNLEDSLSPARFALLKMIANTAEEQKKPIYIVGGFVRDLILGSASPDFDFVVEGDAIEMANDLKKSYGGSLTSHKKFGTAKWEVEDIQVRLAKELGREKDLNFTALDFPGTIDFVSARREFYTNPTALPQVESSGIKFDLHRRDFTINTLALRLDGRHFGELHDYWGGEIDLKKGIVRVLHSLSFVDDPTRILRAVRFEQRFNFEIAARTLKLLKSALPLLMHVSGDRIRHELDNILMSQHISKSFARLQELNIFSAIHADLRWIDNIAHIISNLPPSDEDLEIWGLSDLERSIIWPGFGYLVWLSEFQAEEAKSIAKRLRLRKELLVAIQSLITLQTEIPIMAKLTPGEIEARLSLFSPLAIYALYVLTSNSKHKSLLKKYNKTWKHVRTHTSGHDLRALGIEPGPNYKRILGKIRSAKLNNKISTKKDEKDFLEKLIRE